jgi:hypothetical protein
MNEQYEPSFIVERNEPEMNNPVVNTDPFAEIFPVDAALIHETPLGGDVAVDTPTNEAIVHKAPIGETVPYENPVTKPVVEGSWVSKSMPDTAPVSETITHEAPIDSNAVSSASLLNREESERFRTRWNEIQGKFVDEPRAAVQQADVLVSEVVDHITQVFANEHSSLEGQWNQGNDVSTEDLRKALQHYRTFFNRLVV